MDKYLLGGGIRLRKFYGCLFCCLLILWGSLSVFPAWGEPQPIPSSLKPYCEPFHDYDQTYGYVRGIFLQWQAAPGAVDYKIVITDQHNNQTIKNTTGYGGFIYNGLAGEVTPPWWNVFDIQGAASCAGSLKEAEKMGDAANEQDMAYCNTFTFEVYPVYPQTTPVCSLGIYYPNKYTQQIAKVNPNYDKIPAWINVQVDSTLIDFGNASNYPIIWETQNKTNNLLHLRIKITRPDNSEPIADQRFHLKVYLNRDYINANGGHFHWTNRSLGSISGGGLSSYGMTLTQSEAQVIQLPEMTTDGNGECLLRYRYPNIGGILAFRVAALDQNGYEYPYGGGKDTASLLVGLQDLESFSPNTNWGAMTIPYNTDDHPRNYFANPVVVRNLEYLIVLFLKDSAINLWDKKHDIALKAVSLNDFALPFGGVFDIDSNWNKPHSTHRAGWEGDFNKIGATNPIWIDRSNKEKFMSYIRKKFKDAIYDEDEFDRSVHIYFYGNAIAKEGVPDPHPELDPLPSPTPYTPCPLEVLAQVNFIEEGFV